MPRPLVRRRHTVFPNQDLRRLTGDANDDEDVHGHLRRPGTYPIRKTQSFYRDLDSAVQTLPLTELGDMDDETANSATAADAGSEPTCDEVTTSCEAQYDEQNVAMEAVGPDADADAGEQHEEATDEHAISPAPRQASADEGHGDTGDLPAANEEGDGAVENSALDDKILDSETTLELQSQDGTNDDPATSVQTPSGNSPAEQGETCPELNKESGHEDEQAENPHDQDDVKESPQESVPDADTISPLDSPQSGHSQTSIADDSEHTRREEESLKQVVGESVKITPMKPGPRESAGINNRTRTEAKAPGKKIWKPAGSVGGIPTHQNGKSIGSAVTSNRGGKPGRRANRGAPTRLPPISVAAVPAGGRRSDGLTTGRGGTGLNTTGRGGTGLNSTGRLYRCSATACVTVLPQPSGETQAGGDEQTNASADSANRNRNYSSSTTTRMNGDRFPLVVADKNLTSQVSIVDGDSLRIVIDGFQVPRHRDVVPVCTDPVSVRIDVAMTTGGATGRLARGGPYQRASQHPLLGPRRQVTPPNRDVITTRAVGPSFCR